MAKTLDARLDARKCGGAWAPAQIREWLRLGYSRAEIAVAISRAIKQEPNT